MKKLLLTLAAVAMMIPAMAAGGQKNLFLELRNSRIFYKDADISLEQLQEIITGDVYYDNILVVTDLSSQAYMMFGIKDAVEQKTSAQLVFVVRPTSKDQPAFDARFLPECIYLGRSFFYEPIADEEFWKDDEENPEDSEITVLMDRRKDLYLYGRRIFPVLLIDKIKEKIGDEEKLGSLRIKLTTDVSVGDLISWDESFSGELAQRGVETNYAYFYGPSRITGSYAFDIVKADFADFDIPTIDIDDTGAYLSAPVFDGNTDVVAFGKYAQRYVEYDIDKYEGTQGRIWVDFTVCADGSVKDVVAVHGIESIRECAVEAVKNTPPYWTPARDKDGNPVNMRVHKIMVKVEAHL